MNNSASAGLRAGSMSHEPLLGSESSPPITLSPVTACRNSLVFTTVGAADANRVSNSPNTRNG